MPWRATLLGDLDGQRVPLKDWRGEGGYAGLSGLDGLSGRDGYGLLRRLAGEAGGRDGPLRQMLLWSWWFPAARWRVGG